MIAVFEIKLRTLDPLTLPQFSGTIAKSLFLRLVAATDPRAAIKAHEGASPRPYSVTPLLHHGRPAPQLLPPGAQLGLRVAVADDELAQTLVESLVTGEAQRLHLGRARLYTEAIGARLVRHSDLPAGTFTGARVEFHTPVRFSVASTARRRKPKFRLFPTPEHLFHSLSDHWNLYAPEGLKAPTWLPALVRDYIVETGYRLRRTALKATQGRVLVGSTGWVNYRPVEPVDDKGWLNRLLAYGELFNAGTGRSLGLGMMTWIPLEPREKQRNSGEEGEDGDTV